MQFVNASGKLSAPFYFCDNKPHECSQTWQVVRSEFDQMMLDNAREHGVDAHEGVHVLEVLFEGDRAVGVHDPGRTSGADGREVRAKVVVDASGQAALLQNRLQAARVGSDAEQGRDLDLLAGRLSRHRPRRRARRWSCRRPTSNGWFWYIPLHDDIVSVGVVAPFDYLFKGRGTGPREDLRRGSRALPGREAARSRGATRVTGYFATQGLLVPVARRSRATAGCSSATRSGFSIRCTRRACCWRCKSGELAADAIVDGLASGDTSAPRSSGKWGAGLQRGRRSHAAAGVRVLRRLQLRPRSSGSIPHLRGTVTDLLIGDLFTDRVDKVWEPMESLDNPGKAPIPAVERGAVAGKGESQGQRARAPRTA